MLPIERPISPAEAVVITNAIERAGVVSLGDELTASITTLVVIGECECGCASVDFAAAPSDVNPTILADGTGRTPDGGQVAVIVRGRPDAITALEVYDLDAGDGGVVLPVAESIIPWG